MHGNSLFSMLLQLLIHLCVCPCLPLSLTRSVAPAEPLLCKFADGGQKKRQTQVKYPQNGRPWTREGEVRLESVLHRKIPLRIPSSFFLKDKWKWAIVTKEPCLSISLVQHNPFCTLCHYKRKQHRIFLRENHTAGIFKIYNSLLQSEWAHCVLRGFIRVGSLVNKTKSGILVWEQ